MNDQHAGQPQETQSSLTRDNRNWSQPSSDAIGIPLSELKQPSTPKSAKVEPIDQASIHKSTGPRTPQGKKRCKYNALKHGLLSKAILLKGESRAEYESLLYGLQEDWQPQGTSETILVETLAALVWRKRRVLQAESAEIAGRAEFLEFDSSMAQYAEAWDYARSGEVSGGMLRHWDNRVVVQQAIEMLSMLRLSLEAIGFQKMHLPGFLENFTGSTAMMEFRSAVFFVSTSCYQKWTQRPREEKRRVRIPVTKKSSCSK